MKKILLVLLFFCTNAIGAITDGKFGINQIFDVQYWWNGTTLNASNFIAPYDKNFQTVTVSSGQYFQFFPSTTHPGKYGLGLYNSNGTLAKVVHDYGDITALGSGAIFYIGSGFFGNVISTAQGYNYGASAQFTNMDTSVTATDLTNYTWASTTPLAAGQTAQPAAPAVTVTGTTTTYTTRTVVSGNTTYVYRTPVTTTNYSNGTSTSANGTEALYQTKVASTVTTNTISGNTLTTIATPINTVTPADGSATFVESNGTATSTSQTVQRGLNFQVWRYDPKNYTCVLGICAWNLTYRTPSTNAANYGNPVNSGVTTSGIFIATNSDLPNNDNSWIGANDGTVMRYSGTITAPITTTRPAGTVYRLYFYNNTDDGFVLRINGNTIINQNETITYQALFGTTSSGWMDVVAGQTYNIEAWYWNTTGGFGNTFYWDYGDGLRTIPNSAYTTGTIGSITVDTSGMSYSNSSVVNVTGTAVSLAPTIEGGTITMTNSTGQEIITSGSNSAAGLNSNQHTRTNNWANAPARPSVNGISLDVNGANNTIHIEQVGNSNTVTGIGETPARITGSANSVTVKQGTAGPGQNEIQLRISGDSNVLDVSQARNNQGTATGTNAHYHAIDITGYQNNLISQQSNVTLGSHYQETTINGNQNNVTSRQTDNGNKIMFNTVNGNNNNISAVQKDTGQHQLVNNLSGNNHSVTVVQEGHQQNKANIDLTNAGGAATLDLQQSGGKNFTIIQSCTNPAGCSITVQQ